jgi:hypothetical protein
VTTESRAGPAFPAAATTTSPRRQAISTAAENGSRRYDVRAGAPKERLMMRMLYAARCARTHSIPRTTDDTRPLPTLSRTRTSTMFVCGAIPTNCPNELVPLPAMIPAMCVPWPPGSAVARWSAKLTEARTRFEGCVRSGSAATPESSTATVMPAPVMPRCQSLSAFTTRG